MKILTTATRTVTVLLLLAAAVVGIPRSASADELGITLVHLRPTSVELVVVCPTDPPTTVFVLAGATSPQVIGQLSIDCVGGGVPQTVVVPLTGPLVPGAVVDLSATVSGDSGEINAWFPGSVVEADQSTSTLPATPTHVRVRPGSTTATVTWRAPTPEPGAAPTGYRVWLHGVSVTVPATQHRVVLRRLCPGRAYVLHVQAFNSAGRSDPTSTTFRTHGR